MASALNSLRRISLLSRSPPPILTSRRSGGAISIPATRGLRCEYHTRRQFCVSSGSAAAATSLGALSTATPAAIAGASSPPVTSSSAQEGVISGTDSGAGKTVFVAGATGNTGKRIVRELLAKGFRVRAGCRDIAKAKQVIPSGSGDGDNIDFVLADVTQGKEKLAQAMKGVDAVVVATGFRPNITDPLASWNVDNLGTVALVDACSIAGVKRFVMVSSLLVNGAAVGQFLNPAYIILNLIGLTLVAKLQAEKYVRQSGIEYTIIRPGGLKNESPSGNVVLAPEDTLFDGSVSRDTVAQIVVDSLLYSESSFKVVELVAKPDAPAKSVQELLAALPA